MKGWNGLSLVSPFGGTNRIRFKGSHKFVTLSLDSSRSSPENFLSELEFTTNVIDWHYKLRPSRFYVRQDDPLPRP